MELARVQIPILIINGTIQVSVQEAELLKSKARLNSFD
jgi:hypothetical protein